MNVIPWDPGFGERSKIVNRIEFLDSRQQHWGIQVVRQACRSNSAIASDAFETRPTSKVRCGANAENSLDTIRMSEGEPQRDQPSITLSKHAGSLVQLVFFDHELVKALIQFHRRLANRGNRATSTPTT